MGTLPFAQLFDSQYMDFTEDLPFWLHVVSQSPGAVLELGCGSGRVLLTLAREGHHVTGIDIDPAMLTVLGAKATRELQSRMTLRHADIRSFALNQRFASVLLPCNLFAYFEDEDAQRVLEQVQHHLNPDGILAMDLPNAPIILADNHDEDEILDTFQDQTTGFPVQVSASQSITPDRRRADVEWHYDVLKTDGKVERISVSRSYHLRTAADIDMLLRSAGMQVHALYGGYEREPYQATSPRMLVLATPDAGEK